MIYPLLSEDVEGAVIGLDDVTVRIHMEEVMVQTGKMISLGDLVAWVAHEINNPLGGIRNGSQNLTRRLLPELPKIRIGSLIFNHHNTLDVESRLGRGTKLVIRLPRELKPAPATPPS